ncbi:hypothetical protein Gotur_013916 [Gossypium turneri]
MSQVLRLQFLKNVCLATFLLFPVLPPDCSVVSCVLPVHFCKTPATVAVMGLFLPSHAALHIGYPDSPGTS